MSEFRFLLATRLRTVSPSARAESRSSSEINPRMPEPSPKANTLTPKTAWPTPSPGSPMRTVSKPPVTTCPLPHPCPSTLSSSSTTWEPLASFKFIYPITNQSPHVLRPRLFKFLIAESVIKRFYSKNSWLPFHTFGDVKSKTSTSFEDWVFHVD